MSSPASLTLLTPPTPGAIAILQLTGPLAPHIIHQLTGLRNFPPGRMKLLPLGSLDRGMVACLRLTPQPLFQIMPHGSPLLVESLIHQLIQLGATYQPQPSPADLFPEAASPLEADMLWTLTHAASPAAIPLLLAQPPLWANLLSHSPLSPPQAQQILALSRQLDRLLHPPTIVLIGPPNVGKSTLSNRILGYQASLVADLPGTTRDWVAGLAHLPLQPHPPSSSPTLIPLTLAVRWLDTPGLRQTSDPLEQQAIELAQPLIASADLCLALRDPHTHWPDTPPRPPQLWILNKADLLPPPPPSGSGHSPDQPLALSALTGQGLNRLIQRILELLNLANLPLAPAPLWAFSQTLKNLLDPLDLSALQQYVRPRPL